MRVRVRVRVRVRGLESDPSCGASLRWSSPVADSMSLRGGGRVRARARDRARDRARARVRVGVVR